LSHVANDLRGRLSDNAQQLLELDSPLGLCGLDIFKCMCCTTHFDRLSHLLTIISTAASVQLPGGLQKSITDVKGDEKEEVKFLIMFDLPSDQANIVETYVKDNKENSHCTWRSFGEGGRRVEGEEQKREEKGQGW
jgi:hypothetical protein